MTTERTDEEWECVVARIVGPLVTYQCSEPSRRSNRVDVHSKMYWLAFRKALVIRQMTLESLSLSRVESTIASHAFLRLRWFHSEVRFPDSTCLEKNIYVLCNLSAVNGAARFSAFIHSFTAVSKNFDWQRRFFLSNLYCSRTARFLILNLRTLRRTHHLSTPLLSFLFSKQVIATDHGKDTTSKHNEAQTSKHCGTKFSHHSLSPSRHSETFEKRRWATEASHFTLIQWTTMVQ